MSADGRVRVDAWLWAVRIYKSRSLATSACKAGHVRVGGVRAKPSALVGEGDRIEVTHPAGDRVLIVRRTLTKRVAAPLAAQAMIDQSPPPPPRELRPAPVAVRERGAGRPTKRERRELDRLRGRR